LTIHAVRSDLAQHPVLQPSNVSDTMIRITDRLHLDESELEEVFVRASGPGGQNVNKVSSAVEMRFNVRASANLPGPVRVRLERLAGRRMTKDGVLIIRAERFRTQEQNRADARARLVDLIQRAAVAPKYRIKTKPGRGAVERRLKAKTERGQTKRRRQDKPSLD
jgi:ribosome-associated protein